MITASHNSKEYNGYKLYWSNGCQVRQLECSHKPYDSRNSNKIKYTI